MGTLAVCLLSLFKSIFVSVDLVCMYVVVCICQFILFVCVCRWVCIWLHVWKKRL